MEEIILNGQRRQAEKGTKISLLLQENGRFPLPCAGQGRCGKCKVRVSGSVSLPDAVEKEKLTREELAGNIRLACRTRVEGTCRVEWKEKKASGILLAGELTGSARPLFRSLGAAVDIGTTTLAAQLYDESGLLAEAGAVNPQGAFGADVISRIEKSMAGQKKELADAVRCGINNLLARLTAHSGHSVTGIDTLVITGNTAMLYLLTERDTDCLSRAPFIEDWRAGEWRTAEELGLSCASARVYLPPCISAFVGADITTALLAVGMDQTRAVRLLADIGTNGEIALWKNGRILCCSTAAGPAFEGAGLSCGMQGEEGAISHVSLSPDGFCAEVIGRKEPAGICGSGVVDAVSCLLQNGQMDDTGYLEEEEPVIAGTVKLTQEDIRKVQLAKSAICAGILTMLHREGMEAGELEELLVAGGFGSYLDLENAMAIGLLPRMDADKIRVCGNAALAGAAKLLLDEDALEPAGTLAANAQTVNLAVDEYFQECYMEGMLF